MKKQFLFASAIFVFAVSAVIAQTSQIKTISGGVINGKAASLPAPKVPAAAKAVKACGIVNVQVSIDTDGNIASADAVSGHPLLREPAVNAAREAKFNPTQLSGQPVNVSGIIVYNFDCGSENTTSTNVADESVDSSNSGNIRIGTALKSGPTRRVGSSENISGGVVNGKAISLPVPEFPAAAKAAKASGAVNVQILIDEAGNVVEANAVSGHPLLRQAAEDAARQARFAQTMLENQPVKVSGVIVYNFGGSAVKINDLEKNKFFGLGLKFSFVEESINSRENGDLKLIVNKFSIEFPQFADNFKTLESLNKNALQNQNANLIDAAFSSIKNKLNASEAWQFDVGRQISKAMLALNKSSIINDVNKSVINDVDESALRAELFKLRDLTFTVPTDISIEMLDNIKVIAGFADHQDLNNLSVKLNLLKALKDTLNKISSEQQ